MRALGAIVLLLLAVPFAGCVGMIDAFLKGGFEASPRSEHNASIGSPPATHSDIPCQDTTHAGADCGNSARSYGGDWKAVANVERSLTALEQRRMERLKAVMQKFLPMVQNLDSYQRIYAVDQHAINAFVSSDAIVVFDGLFNVVDNEDELAVIVGHEIGHLVKNHVNGWNAKNISSILGSLGDIGLCLSQHMCDNEASSLMQPVTFKFSRDDEREADDLGFNLLCQAGYNPSAVVSVWRKMALKLHENNEFNLMSTHPSNAERLDTLSAKVSTCHRQQVNLPALPSKKIPRGKNVKK